MKRIFLATAAALALMATQAQAQFGPPPPSSGPKLAPPKAFPPPGTFPTTESVTLYADDPKAQIHYTWDGTLPTADSPLYDPSNVLFIAGVYDGDHGLKTGYTLRAVTVEDGHTTSEPATFQYLIDRRDRTAYVSEIVAPGVRMIRDSDNDKMFLVDGAKFDALIDTGMGRGDLKDYVARFTRGRPLKLILTHRHIDHIGQADQFIRRYVAYIGAPDRPETAALLASRGVPQAAIDQHLQVAHDGQRVGLGDRSLEIYVAPGHTDGSLVILDASKGDLFSGDSFGSNSPTIPDALFMQESKIPLDVYLATVKGVHARLRGRFQRLMTGHNDHPLLGDAYIDNLQTALQSLMDKGDAALIPSYRPAHLKQVVVGDRFTDPNWVAVNVNPGAYLPAPVEQISSLSALTLKGAALDPPFDPRVFAYTAKTSGGPISVAATPTSTRAQGLTVNGQAASPGADVAVAPDAGILTVVATAPDGQASSRYVVSLRR